jgi:hypothetical protein
VQGIEPDEAVLARAEYIFLRVIAPGKKGVFIIIPERIFR